MPSTVSTANPVVLADILANAVAQDRPLDGSVRFPRALEADIASVVAAQWNVPPDELSLHWGVVRDPNLIDEVTGFRLVGKGVNGWYAVLFDCNERPAFAVRLRVGIPRNVPFARRDLAQGHTIEEQDFTLEEQLTWGPPARVSGRFGPGWRVVETIAAGQAIPESHVQPAPVIFRGDRVKMVWHRGVVKVTLDGTAEHDAGEGRAITVRLRGRRGTRAGVVTGPGRAVLET